MRGARGMRNSQEKWDGEWGFPNKMLRRTRKQQAAGQSLMNTPHCARGTVADFLFLRHPLFGGFGRILT